MEFHYECGKCGKGFKQKGHYKIHLYKKFPCVDLTCCSFCGKKFSKNSNARKHEGICKQNTCKQIEVLKEEIVNLKKVQELEALKVEKNKLKSFIIKKKNIMNNNGGIIGNNNILNSNTNSNNTNSNNTNIQLILPFGKEDFSHLDEQKLMNIMKSGFMCIPDLVKAVHFDKNKPKNHNVYISNLQNSYANVFDGDVWNACGKEAVLDALYRDKREFLTDVFEKFEKFDKRGFRSFQRFLEVDEEADDRIKIIKKEVKNILYNKKEIIMITKRKHERKSVSVL